MFHGVRFERATLYVQWDPEETPASALAKSSGFYDIFNLQPEEQGCEANELVGPVLTALAKLGTPASEWHHWLKTGNLPELLRADVQDLVRFGFHVLTFANYFPSGFVFSYKSPQGQSGTPREEGMFSLREENFVLKNAVRRLIQEKHPGEDVSKEVEDFLFRVAADAKIRPALKPT